MKYNHNLTKEENADIQSAEEAARAVFGFSQEETYEEAKAKKIAWSGKIRNFSLIPAYKDIIDGKDYGSNEPFAILEAAMLVG